MDGQSGRDRVDGRFARRQGRGARSSDGRRVGASQRALGKTGEDAAAAWYQSHGYQVVARNWSCREGELDIVARRGRLVVFCEVKARSSGAFGLPVEAVGTLKQARVRRLAARWFAEQASEAPGGGPGAGGGPVRFDVASVLSGQVEVIEAAF